MRFGNDAIGCPAMSNDHARQWLSRRVPPSETCSIPIVSIRVVSIRVVATTADVRLRCLPARQENPHDGGKGREAGSAA